MLLCLLERVICLIRGVDLPLREADLFARVGYLPVKEVNWPAREAY